MGHWERGSSMPALYDSQSGVTELSARSSIVCALAKGWSPAKNGELSSKYSKECVIESKPVNFTMSSKTSKLCKRATKNPMGSVKGLVVVAHSKRKSLHYVDVSSSVSVCRWWKCGTISNPSRFALFGDPTEFTDYKWCVHCSR